MRVLAISLLFLLISCGDEDTYGSRGLESGAWRFVFDLNGHGAPINAEIQRSDTSTAITFINAQERIEVKEVRMAGDSIFIRMPLYDTELIGVIGADGKNMTGHWINHNRGADYKVPFSAEMIEPNGITYSSGDAKIVDGRWAVRFDPDHTDSSSAIGLFTAHENGTVTGSFATETGDHRFLDGEVRNDSMRLSSFDGSHVYLFVARIAGDSMFGRFNSGIHWEEPWIAVKDADFGLRDPASLTNSTTELVEFSFPDLNGEEVSSQDPRFRGKALILQVMGSWCSNCADEAAELNDLYRKYRSEGLEVVGVAFEKQEDPTRAKSVLRRFSDGLHLEYPILFGGHAKTASEKLPFIDKLRSYPTSIFIDHNGKVRSILTGNYGPGTGELHHNYRKKINDLVEQMIRERSFAQPSN